jgi:hypothetical protein
MAMMLMRSNCMAQNGLTVTDGPTLTNLSNTDER